MKLIRHRAIIVAALLLSSPLHASEKDDIIATVNGTPVTVQQLNHYAQMRQSQGEQLPQQMILDEIINRELITQDATKRGLNKDDQFIDTLKEQEANLLAAYTLQKTIQESGEIDDATLQAEYDVYVATLGDLEYRASHILLDDRSSAVAIITELKSGKNFSKLAQEKSTGPSGPEGGSLGWFRPEQMVPAFAEALIALKPGQYSQQPVETQFGWHVIQLEERRKLPAPSLESMREKLHNNLVNQRLENYIKALRDNANIIMGE